ncbi:MAG TPA: hypothetical protein VKY39_08460 [Aggregatilineales bacterium]|nr:hypothetical protein [Aggregatilineales bacterium]
MTHSQLGTSHGAVAAYEWEPKPVNVYVSRSPRNRLQSYILSKLRERLEARGCIFVDRPDQATDLGPVAHVGIAFGQDLQEEISPLELLGKLPKPRGSMLVINTVESMPGIPLFDLARGQLVKKAGHFGVVAEGDPDGEHVNRALWASMAGNNRLLDGDEDTIFDQIALRVQAHVSAEKVTVHQGDSPTLMTWAEWSAAPVHADIARAARALGAAGIIEDEVPLGQYGSGEQVRSVLRFLQKAALGEGMRSQIDMHLRVMGVTTSGGNKINVSPDPADGHVIPIGELSWTGYYRALPADCPVSYVPPSVETHENGMVYLASALVNAGLVDSLDGFLNYLRAHFAEHETVEIVPDGMEPAVKALDHFHRQPKAGTIAEPERIEIVYPDTSRFPEIDFPCGVREAELHLLSAFFQSESFRTPGSLGRKVIVAVLPGHGSVAAYGGPRDELTDVLVNGMEMEEIVRI